MTTTETFYVIWASGGEMTANTLDGAKRLVRAVYANAVFSDLDPESRGNPAIVGRALAWADEATSQNDDGKRAVAEILHVRGTHADYLGRSPDHSR